MISISHFHTAQEYDRPTGWRTDRPVELPSVYWLTIKWRWRIWMWLIRFYWHENYQHNATRTRSSAKELEIW